MMQALALRICATKALTDATFAEARVFDSAIDPIDASLSNTTAPVILVSTEQDEADVTARDLRGSDAKITLLIEIAFAGRAMVTVDDIQSPQIFVPSSDSRIEIMLDMVRRQVVRTLMIGGGDWGDLFRTFVCQFVTVKSRRGAGDESGARFASRMVMLEIIPLDEPEFGGLHGKVWDTFLAKLRDDNETKAIAGQIEVALVGETVPEWRRAADDLGISLEVADASGLPAAAPVMVSDGELVGGIDVVAPPGGAQ